MLALQLGDIHTDQVSRPELGAHQLATCPVGHIIFSFFWNFDIAELFFVSLDVCEEMLEKKFFPKKYFSAREMIFYF